MTSDCLPKELQFHDAVDNTVIEDDASSRPKVRRVRLSSRLAEVLRLNNVQCIPSCNPPLPMLKITEKGNFTYLHFTLLRIGPRIFIRPWLS